MCWLQGRVLFTYGGGDIRDVFGNQTLKKGTRKEDYRRLFFHNLGELDNGIGREVGTEEKKRKRWMDGSGHHIRMFRQQFRIYLRIQLTAPHSMWKGE